MNVGGFTMQGFTFNGINVEAIGFNRSVNEGYIIATTRSAYQITTVASHLEFEVYQANGGGVTGSALAIASNGNVGIGMTTPGADLANLSSPPSASTPIFEVNGDIALTQGGGGQMFFPDGSVQSTAWNGTTLSERLPD